ncbi:unnamed protein product [Moneuplotes crassus]|uniref:Uncharacterized protein n=1 Tax=Euplotes crassus TaxID=5936 RepID=A0AAD1U7R8_EUPCR|nr:unnamed protein product [Moneuplotes crassus]
MATMATIVHSKSFERYNKAKLRRIKLENDKQIRRSAVKSPFRNTIREFDKEESEQIKNSVVITKYHNPYQDYVNKGRTHRSPITLSRYTPFKQEDKLKEQEIISQNLKASDSQEIINQLREINSSEDLHQASQVKEIMRQETKKIVSEMRIQGEISDIFNKPIKGKKSQIIRTGHRNLTFKRWLRSKKKKLVKNHKHLIKSISASKLTVAKIKEYLNEHRIESDKIHSFNMVKLNENLKAIDCAVSQKFHETKQKASRNITVSLCQMDQFIKTQQKKQFDGLRLIDNKAILRKVFRPKNILKTTDHEVLSINSNDSSDSNSAFREELKHSIPKITDILYSKSKTQRAYSLQRRSKFLQSSSRKTKKVKPKNKHLQKVFTKISLLRIEDLPEVPSGQSQGE